MEPSKNDKKPWSMSVCVSLATVSLTLAGPRLS